ncbi:hypothetical protein [uncultured Shewanella sp.]|nr:hypothetical protein [uncultured Shewanella sp.]
MKSALIEDITQEISSRSTDTNKTMTTSSDITTSQKAAPIVQVKENTQE